MGATQVSACVTDRMAQNLELKMAITFNVGIIEKLNFGIIRED